jgi:DNA polymerase I-like protein with 3'-5' exonuclease and polymerase domains
MHSMQNPSILFVTRRSCPKVTIPTVSPEYARQIVLTQFNSEPTWAHDIETTGSCPYRKKLLLEAWYSGNPLHPILVIDAFTVRTEEVITNADLRGRRVIAHNAAFEKRWLLRRGMFEGVLACTMVNEQTIMSGIPGKIYNIVDCMKRRGIPIRPEMDKAIRNEFVGADPATFELEDKHIKYNATDVIDLHLLDRKQQEWIDKLDMNFLIHRLRTPLVTILGEGEMIGFKHDSEYWMEICNRRIVQANALIEQLDAYVVSKGLDLLELNPTLAAEYSKRESRIEKMEARFAKLTAQVVDYERRGKTTIKAYQVCCDSIAKLGREMSNAHEPLPEPTINWGSPQQPLEVMRKLGIRPLPMANDPKTYKLKEGVGKAARANWFSDNPTHEHLEFMQLFDKFKKLDHNIKSFGAKWIETYFNPITGKVHTCFRQSGTRTGRFASGDVENGYFNLQQIPGEITDFGNNVKIAEYRKCFGTDPGRKIATLDYTGCEIVCMVSLSQDLDLKRVSDLPDQHSYMGTKCWRAVYEQRYKNTGDTKWKELAENYVMGGKSKERTKFKQSGIFPVIYGVKAPKVASIQGFSRQDGQVFIDTIEAEMPKVVAFVKNKAAFALQHGYVLHNTRTNSRRWFKDVIDANTRNFELTNKESSKVETAARNSPVQGTNVDIIIEAIVTIWRWAKLFKVDVRFLGQVHDELIYDFPEDQDWIPAKLQQLMQRTAQRYLIPELSMKAGCDVGYYWIK